MNRRRALLGGGAAVAGALALAWTLRGGEAPTGGSTRSSPGEETTPGAARGPLPALAPSSELGCAFSPGARFGWSFSVDVRLEFERGALAPAGAPRTGVEVVATRAMGELQALVLTVTPAGEAIVALRPTAWTDAPAEASAASAPWSADLLSPFLLRVDARCRTLAGARHRDTALLAWDRVARLADRFQFMAPPQAAPGAPYSTRHDDSHGPSLISNQHVPGPGRGTLGRRRVRYEGAGSGLEVAIERSTGAVTLADAMWWSALLSDETVRTRMKGAPAFLSTERVRFEPVPADPTAFEGRDLALAHYVWGRPDAAALAAARDAQGPAGLRGESLDSAWAAYRAAVEGDWFGAQKRLRAWLRANPEGAAALEAGLRAGRYTPREAAAISLALAKSGTPEALHALERIAGDASLPENLRTQAISALADAPHPTLATVDTLARLADRQGGPSSRQDLVGSAATMSLGTLVEGQVAGAPADAARAYLQTRLESADADRLTEALWAVGNTGDAAFLDAVAPKAAADDPDVRAAAMHATRKMRNDPEARALVAERFRTETHPEVAAEAAAAQREQLGASGRLTAHELNLYRSKLVGAPEPLRREIVLTVGAVAPQQPEARALLAEWYPLETSMPVRQLIGRFVPATMLP